MGRIIYWNNRMWFENPLQLGPVLLYQAGEAYINGYMPSDGHKQFCFEITFVVSGKCINYTADEYPQLPMVAVSSSLLLKNS